MMIHRKKRRMLGILLAAFLLTQPLAAMPVSADAETDEHLLIAAEETEAFYVEQETYSDYYDRYAGEPRPSAEVLVEGTAYKSLEDAGGGVSVGSFGSEYDQEIKDNILIWDAADGSVTYEIQKSRVSIRLIAPYSEERRKAASEYAKKNGIGNDVRIDDMR